jgi:hypothetical protein
LSSTVYTMLRDAAVTASWFAQCLVPPTRIASPSFAGLVRFTGEMAFPPWAPSPARARCGGYGAPAHVGRAGGPDHSVEPSAMIVSGFVEPISRELPLGYAVEMNRLIQVQMEGFIG